MRFTLLHWISILVVAPATVLADQASEKKDAISFARDIAPILQRNCVACHREKQAEGGLSLESEKAIRAGGDSGDLIVAGDWESSVLYARVSGEEEPLMPPEHNSVGAVPLSDSELRLLRNWIQAGATIDRISSDDMDWQPIPESVRTSLALAVAPDGRQAAVAHANRVELVQLQDGKPVAKLVDPDLDQADVADVDVIQSVVFSPLGDRIATGGFRSVRIWKRESRTPRSPDYLQHTVGRFVLSPDAASVAILNQIGDLEIWDRASSKRRLTIPFGEAATDLDWQHPGSLLVGDRSGGVQVYDPSSGKRIRRHQMDQSTLAVSQAPGGDLVAWVGLGGKVVLLSGDQVLAPASIADVNDATAVCWTASGKLVVGTKSGDAVVMDPAADKVIARLQHGSAIGSLAASPKSDRLITGGHDGSAKLWNLADGQLTATYSGDPISQVRIASLDQDARRKKSRVDQLNGQTESINKRLETEEAALKKVVEAHQKTQGELDAKTKQKDEVAGQVAATEKQIAAANQIIDQSKTEAAKIKSAISAATAAIDRINAELQPLTEQASLANAKVSAAEGELAKMMKELEKAKSEAKQAGDELNQKKAELMRQQKQQSDAMAELEQSNKAAEQAAATVKSETEGLGKKKESLAKVEQELATKQAELDKRKQALVTSTKTRDRAQKAVPEHQETIRRRSNELARLQSEIEETKSNLQRTGPVASVAVSPNDQSVAVLRDGGQVVFYELESGRPVCRRDYPISAAIGTSHSVFLNDSELLVAAAETRPTILRRDSVWVLEHTIGGPDQELIADRVTALDFGKDGRTIAIGSGAPSRSGQILIVSAGTGEVLRRFDDVHSDAVLCLAYSPDGRRLASASADKTIRLIDVSTGSVFRSLDGHTHHVLSVAWKLDGRQLASGSADGTVKIWDADSGQRVRSLNVTRGEVTALSFVGDSHQIASAASDGQVRIHDANNGKQIRAANAQGDFLFSLDVTPDGQRLLSSGQRGTVSVWQTSDAKQVATW